MARTEVQVRDQVTSLRAFMGADVVRTQIAASLPKTLSVDRALRCLYTLVQTSPQLLECTPQSILKGLIQASELGLELSGVMGQAYLVPRNREATFQLGWKGVIVLAYRSAQLASFRIKSAHANDEFDFAEGTSPYIRHRITPGDRGELVAVYAVAHLVTGGCDFEVMSIDEVKAHRDRYSPAAAKSTRSAWSTNFEAMAHKTVARKLGKRLPASVEMQEAIGLDEYNEAGVGEPAAPRHAGLADKLAEQVELPPADDDLDDGISEPKE